MVITPELNKSFKFQSEWPDNSSQAYLLHSILKDLTNDKKIELVDSDNKNIVKSKVNYPNNDELVYQKVYFDNDGDIEKVEVYDKNDIVKIKVLFESVDLRVNLSKNDFDIEEYIDEEEQEDSKPEENSAEQTTPKTEEQKQTENNTTNQGTATEQNEEETNQNNTQTSSFNLDSVIYPLYIPGETYLTNSETIKTEDGNRVILTFTGEKNFVIIEEVAISEPTMKIVPVYGEPLMLSSAIGALTGNSLTWDSNNISYYLASTDLSTKEMLTIANSLGNTTLVSKEK